MVEMQSLLLEGLGEEARTITNLATCGAGHVYFWQAPSPMTLLHWLPHPLELTGSDCQWRVCSRMTVALLPPRTSNKILQCTYVNMTLSNVV